MAEAVVGRAFVGVHQDVIGFAQLFKFIFGVCIVRVFVRVKLDRELAVGALHFLLGCGPGDSQDFVIIAFVRSHLSADQEQEHEHDYGRNYFAGPLETTTLEGRSNRSFIR
jgi:hypothetical protein